MVNVEFVYLVGKGKGGFSRAFYHEREVLVMDEATSALDNETELEIIEEVKLLKGQKTLIVIAHRLSTVQHCDMIYRLEYGKIIESGTPDQVLKLKKVPVERLIQHFCET